MARSARAPAAIGCILAAGTAGLVLRPPRWLTRAAARRFPEILFSADTRAPAVALTLDDGPDASLTPRLLDVLAAHRCRATLFMLGSNALRCRDVVGRAADEGHELGNHLWEDRRSLVLSRAQFERDLLRTHEVLEGRAPVALMRPGGGLIRRDQLAVLERHGYRCVLGSVYPYDAHLPAGRYLAADVARRAAPGSIIILHEGRPDRAPILGLLEILLPRLRRRGFDVTTVSELMAFARLREHDA
jgi:peptidoglycan/xylan/chitin deacetylase (PgdA/CDA1 family)